MTDDLDVSQVKIVDIHDVTIVEIRDELNFLFFNTVS